MKSINKPGDNLGGLIKFWLVPPDVVSSLQNGLLALTGTDDVYEIYCSPGSIGFEEPMEVKRGGKLYLPTLSGFIPKDSADAETMLLSIAGRKYLVVYLDQNEQYKVAGTPDIPLRVIVELNTGTDTPNRNGHTITVSGKHRNKAVFIANPFA